MEPSLPPVIIKAAITKEYSAITLCTALTLVLKSLMIVGTATFIIVESTTTINIAMLAARSGDQYFNPVDDDCLMAIVVSLKVVVFS